MGVDDADPGVAEARQTMPELPEVETIARELRPLIVGRTILDASFDWPNQIKHPGSRGVRGGCEVVRSCRWIAAPNGSSLRWVPRTDGGEPAVLGDPGEDDRPARRGCPRTRRVTSTFTWSCSLDNGKELRLRDTRKFGRLAVYPPRMADAVLGELGPEPLADDFTLADFRRILRKRRKGRLKTLLMNQEFLAGVGNIYADEALWRARLHPLRSGAGLRPDQERLLYFSLRDVLNEAIDRRGSSVDSYRAPEGRGDMQNFLNVYGRTGQAMPALRPANETDRDRRTQHSFLFVVPAPADGGADTGDGQDARGTSDGRTGRYARGRPLRA